MSKFPDSIRDALRQARNIRRVFVLVTMACPVGIGVLRLFDDRVGSVGIWLSAFLLIAGFLAGGVLLFASNDCADVAADLLDALDAKRKAEQRVKSLEQTVGRASTRHAFLQVLNQMVVVGPIPPDRSEIVRRNQLAVEQLVAMQKTLFGFREGEKWGYCLYAYVPESGRLECVVWKRSWKVPAGHAPRSWAPGEGHVGVAFLQRGDLVYSNAEDPSVKQLVDPGKNTSVYEQCYRSVASIPILDGGDEVLGVVVATSNRRGRFDPEQKAELEPLRDWARFYASMLARHVGE